MPRRASKKPDASQNARRIVDQFIEKTERVIDPAVSAAAAALSKLGASKGGEARAKGGLEARVLAFIIAIREDPGAESFFYGVSRSMR